LLGVGKADGQQTQQQAEQAEFHGKTGGRKSQNYLKIEESGRAKDQLASFRALFGRKRNILSEMVPICARRFPDF
jgi:hypothetical protein